MRIALDAMGGDHAPDSTVKGALAAIEADHELTVVLVGDEQKLKAQLSGPLPERLEIRHTTEVIAADDEPVKAVRRKKDSSMVVAIQMAKEGDVNAAISAGNTGALMTAGLLVAGRMEGIERPGLAAFLPNMDGNVTLAIDVGANVDAKPHHLVQYAVMGSLYMEKVLEYQNPTVGLLNIGTEDGKGNELTKNAFPLLKELPGIRFVGNVESRDVMQGVCRVLVSDGFTGNVMLKTMEGTASAIFSQLKQELTSSFLNKLAAAILKPGLTRFKKQLDYAEYGGAPLLGLKHPVFKAHGSSDARAIKNAILAAARFVRLDVNGLIRKELERLQKQESE